MKDAQTSLWKRRNFLLYFKVIPEESDAGERRGDGGVICTFDRMDTLYFIDEGRQLYPSISEIWRTQQKKKENLVEGIAAAPATVLSQVQYWI